MTMKIIDLLQRSEDWLIWRAQGITATDIPVILGLSPYKTPWQLWAEKTGRLPTLDLSDNPNVRRGVELEDHARRLAEQQTHDVLLPMCGEYESWNTLRASFDGLDRDFQPFEFKAPSEKVWDELKSKGIHSPTYRLYEAQVLTQCVVAGSTQGTLLFYRNDEECMAFNIELTAANKEAILQAAHQFWETIQTDTPPEKDPSRDWYLPESFDQEFYWNAYADAWANTHRRAKTLKAELTVLEKEQKAMQKQLITLMGPFLRADIGGVKVTRFERKGSIDYAKYFQDLGPDSETVDALETYRRPVREDVRISLFERQSSETERSQSNVSSIA